MRGEELTFKRNETLRLKLTSRQSRASVFRDNVLFSADTHSSVMCSTHICSKNGGRDKLLLCALASAGCKCEKERESERPGCDKQSSSVYVRSLKVVVGPQSLWYQGVGLSTLRSQQTLSMPLPLTAPPGSISPTVGGRVHS